MFGSLPSVGLPNLLVGGDSGGDEIDQAMKQVDALSTKLDDAETSIYGLLNSSAPKVNINLPKLNPELFSSWAPVTSTAPEKDRLLSTPDASAADTALSAEKKIAAATKEKALAAAQKAEDARAEMEEQAKQAMAQQAGMVKELAGQGAAGTAALLASVGIGYANLGSLMGPMIAAVVSSVLCFLGLAKTWRDRADGIFFVVNGVFSKMTAKVVDILDTVDDMVMGPLEALEIAIDDMIEQQQPVIDNMKKFEAGMKVIDESFDLPEPSDLKQPLGGCNSMIDEFVGKAKKEVPEKLQDSVQSTFAGRVATNASTFNRFVVSLPLGIVLVVNVLLAILQVYVSVVVVAQAQQATSLMGHESASSHRAARHLRGHDSASSNHSGSHEYASGVAADTNETLKATGIASPGFSSDVDLMPYLQPAVVQVLLSFLQAAFALMMSQGPQICKKLNEAVEKLQDSLNERVNDRIKGAVDKVFGAAFAEVKVESDKFFPKFKESTKKLKQAMETAKKAQALAAGAGAASAAVGAKWP